MDQIGRGSYKRYVDFHCVVSVLNEKVENIGRLVKTLQSASKEIKIMSTTVCGMEKTCKMF